MICPICAQEIPPGRKRHVNTAACLAGLIERIEGLEIRLSAYEAGMRVFFERLQAVEGRTQSWGGE